MHRLEEWVHHCWILCRRNSRQGKKNFSFILFSSFIICLHYFQHILSEPEEIVAINGERLPMRMQVNITLILSYLFFKINIIHFYKAENVRVFTHFRFFYHFLLDSIHFLLRPHRLPTNSGIREEIATSSFGKKISWIVIKSAISQILVHGEMHEMNRLKAGIARNFEDENIPIEVGNWEVSFVMKGKINFRSTILATPRQSSCISEAKRRRKWSEKWRKEDPM